MSTTTPTVKQESTQPARKTFNDWVNADSFKAQLAKALPKHLTPERFIRVLMTASIKQPQLLECTQESMFKGVYDAAALGLELDGRRAHLVPFRNNKKPGKPMEATLIVDYKGMAELAYRSGCVSSIHADTVHEHDIFEVDRGQITKHQIDYKKARGTPYAAYCLIRMTNGGEKSEIMTQDEIYDIRERSKAKESGPWVTDEKEMWKKTVAKRAFKWVPSSPEIRDVFEAEDSIDIKADDITDRRRPSLSEMIQAPAAEPVTTQQTEHVFNRDEAEKLIEDFILESGVSEKALLKEVIESKLIVNEGGFDLFTLIPEEFSAVAAYVRAKAASTTKGGE